MNGKAQSIIAYVFGAIGWLIAYFAGKEQRDDLSRYHLKQALGLIICQFVIYIAVVILAMILLPISESLATLPALLYIFCFLWWVQGLINAIQGHKKPLLFIGKYFENKFSFIDKN